MNSKLLQFTLFLILTFGLTTFFYLCYNKIILNSKNNRIMDNLLVQSTTLTIPTPSPITTLAFISDSHQNSLIFPLLKAELENFKPNLIIHTGDMTDFGDKKNLSIAKNDINLLAYQVIVLPGDHDIAQTSDTSNFDAYFSYPISTVSNGIKILFIPNFYNFTPFNPQEFNNIVSNIDSSQILVSSQPLYVDKDNLFANKFMGSETAFENLTSEQIQKLKIYKSQRDLILNKIRESRTPKIVISGDHHRTSTFKDPLNQNITYHILGSLSKYINLGNSKLLQTSLQGNRYSIVEVFSKPNSQLDFNIKEIELK